MKSANKPGLLKEWLNPHFYSRIHAKQKRWLKFGCAALAVTLTVGAVPFIMGHAADSDEVSNSDVVTKSDVVSEGDLSVSKPVMRMRGTAEPKPNLAVSVENFSFDEATGTLTISGGSLQSSNDVSPFTNAVTALGITLNDVRNMVVGSNVNVNYIFPFPAMPNLISATFDCDLNGISKYMFPNQPQIQFLTFNGNIDGFINEAFKSNMNLQQVVFNGDIGEIHNYVFQNHTALTSVVFNGYVKSIYTGTFEGCTGLTSLAFPKSLFRIFTKEKKGNIIKEKTGGEQNEESISERYNKRAI